MRDLVTGELAGYVTEELNVTELRTAHPDEYGTFSVEPNFRALGARLGADLKRVGAAVKQLSADELDAFQKEGTVTVEGHALGRDDVRISSAHKC